METEHSRGGSNSPERSRSPDNVCGGAEHIAPRRRHKLIDIATRSGHTTFTGGACSGSSSRAGESTVDPFLRLPADVADPSTRHITDKAPSTDDFPHNELELSRTTTRCPGTPNIVLHRKHCWRQRCGRSLPEEDG